MGILIFLLIIAFFFPILLAPLALFAFLFILFIPLKFTVDSFFNLFLIPGQIYKIATNPILKKNHALEHATVNVLEHEYGYNRLAGYATDNGYYIIGAENTYEIKEAARKGLSLMKNGNSQLAIHKNCGTSIIAANLVSALVFLLLLFITGNFSIIFMIIAILMSHLIGPFLGEIFQKYFTTTPDVKEMEIVSSQFVTENNFLKKPPKIFVKTEEISYITAK